jgi:hypothetical protein
MSKGTTMHVDISGRDFIWHLEMQKISAILIIADKICERNDQGLGCLDN